MKKLFVIVISLLLLSCQKKEVLLPKAAETVVSKVEDLSPIYFFFKTEEKDTLIEVNRKNAISSTNWVFNIDKRLPLRLVIPEIKKLQAKKSTSTHKSETAENYFTYTDSIKKSLAFLAFTKMKYKYEKPDLWIDEVRFEKNNLVKFKDIFFSKNELEDFLNNLFIEHESEIIFSYNKNMTFEEYVQYKIFVKKLKVTKRGMTINRNVEFIY